MLTQDEMVFLEKRRRFSDTWNVIGITMLALLGAISIWMYVTVPGLIYPPHVIRELKMNALTPDTMQLAAVLLPVVVLSLFAVTALMIVYGFFIFGNERRYLRIIGKLAPEDSRSEVKNPGI